MIYIKIPFYFWKGIDKSAKWLYNSAIMINYLKDFNTGPCNHMENYCWEVTFLMDRYDLQYISGGGVQLECNGNTYELEAGTCWINLPGIEYKYRPLEKFGSWNHRFVSFNGKVCDAWRDMGLFPTAPCKVSHNLFFPERIDHIIALSSQNLLLNRLEIMNIIEKMLIDLKRSTESGDSQPEWLCGLLEELKFINNPDIDYQELMKKYGVSRRTLFRQFKQMTGLSPHDYHLKSKISYISEQLETTDIPLKQLADETGYKDIFYFSKQFKQFSGLSPSQYRSRNRTGIKPV